VEDRDLSRVVAFTDGVMAVAITLLVLNIDVPPHAKDLDQALVDLLPSVGAYLLSFALVGRYWVIHHNLFETMRAFDGTLMSLNLAFLALIALVPFSTDLSDSHRDDAIAAAVFGVILGLAALVNWTMSAYSVRRGFVREGLAEDVAARGTVGIGVALLFFLSVPAAFLSVQLAQALWIGVIVVRYPLRMLGRGASSP